MATALGAMKTTLVKLTQADVFLSADGIQGKSLICEQLKQLEDPD